MSMEDQTVPAEVPAPVVSTETTPIVEKPEVKKGPVEKAASVVKDLRDRIPLSRALRISLAMGAIAMSTACTGGFDTQRVTVSADVPVPSAAMQEEFRQRTDAVGQAVASAVEQSMQRAPVVAAEAQVKAQEAATTAAAVVEANRPAAEAAAAQAGAALNQAAETTVETAPVVASQAADLAVQGAQTTAEAASNIAQAAAPVASEGAGLLKRFFGGLEQKLGGTNPEQKQLDTSIAQAPTSEKPLDPRIAVPPSPSNSWK